MTSSELISQETSFHPLIMATSSSSWQAMLGLCFTLVEEPAALCTPAHNQGRVVHTNKWLNQKCFGEPLSGERSEIENIQ